MQALARKGPATLLFRTGSSRHRVGSNTGRSTAISAFCPGQVVNGQSVNSRAGKGADVDRAGGSSQGDGARKGNLIPADLC